ncbi:MAG: hypothetical protein HYX48_00380 [Chlamydiales bacterium]|nr:hypothetical protein [Chlamydiales bacterium]
MTSTASSTRAREFALESSFKHIKTTLPELAKSCAKAKEEDPELLNEIIDAVRNLPAVLNLELDKHYTHYFAWDVWRKFHQPGLASRAATAAGNVVICLLRLRPSIAQDLQRSDDRTREWLLRSRL